LTNLLVESRVEIAATTVKFCTKETKVVSSTLNAHRAAAVCLSVCLVCRRDYAADKWKARPKSQGTESNKVG
jgi:hypothetical protein